jgi:hypothetical protein
VLVWCSAVVVAVSVVGFAVVVAALGALAVPVARGAIRAVRRLVAVGRLVAARAIGTWTFAAEVGATVGVVATVGAWSAPVVVPALAAISSLGTPIRPVTRTPAGAARGTAVAVG